MKILSPKCIAVANYIIEEINKYNEDKDFREKILLTAKRLQKLLYFCEIEYMVKNNGKPLFSDEFYAWPHGPVIENVYYVFVQEQTGNMNPIHTSDEPKLSNDIKCMIDQILEITKDIDTSDLVKISKIEGGPHSKVFVEEDENHGQIVPKEDTYLYYSKHKLITQLMKEESVVDDIQQEQTENDSNQIELYYILPYTQHFYSGGNYYNDDKECVDYSPASIDNWNETPLVFDKKEELLNWFIQNAGKPIPAVYRVKFLANYRGVDDVIKITNLGDGVTDYYTALSENEYAWYKESSCKLDSRITWVYEYSFKNDRKKTFYFDFLYQEFIKRGVKIKYNVYKEVIDRTTCFEFVGDPLHRENREQVKGKNLILYKPSPSRSCW